ncbi:MAG: MFS transporter [Thermoplasmatota archaeon]
MFKRIAAIQVLANGAFLASFTYISIYGWEIGLSKLQITLIAALYSIAAFFSSYLFGRAADRYGRRKMLNIGLIGASVFALLQALGWSFPSLAILRFLAGIGFGMFPAALAGYAFSARSKMGRFSAFGALGWGISVFISGIIAEAWGVRSVFIFGSILLLSAFLISRTLKPIPQVKLRTPLFPVKMVMRNRAILFPFILRHATASSIWILWPLFLKDNIGLSLWDIGVVQATNSTTQFVFMYIIGDRIKPRVSVAVGLIATSAAVFSFTLIQTYPLFLATQVVLGFSWAMLYVGALRYMLESNPERATAAGLLNSSISFSSLMGPLISIVIVALMPTISYEGPMYVAGIASVTAFVIFVISARMRRNAGSDMHSQ